MSIAKSLLVQICTFSLSQFKAKLQYYKPGKPESYNHLHSVPPMVAHTHIRLKILYKFGFHGSKVNGLFETAIPLL